MFTRLTDLGAVHLLKIGGGKWSKLFYSLDFSLKLLSTVTNGHLSFFLACFSILANFQAQVVIRLLLCKYKVVRSAWFVNEKF